MRNQRGQMVVEMMLMLALFVGIAVGVGAYFKNNGVFAKMVSGPWPAMAGLIQNGVWGSPADTAHLHPNHINRVNTVRGEPVK